MFKSVLVHLRGTIGDNAVLTAALQVARPFAGHLECLHIRPNLAQMASKVAVVEIDDDANAVVEMLEALQQQSAESAGRASDALAEFCTKEGIIRAEIPPGPDKVNAAFRESTGSEVDELIVHSRYHDLVVVKGGGESAGGFTSYDLGRLLMSAGRPVLIAPGAAARPIRTAVIAWKDAPEAARALTAAMPLLGAAEKIFVFTASEADEPTSDCESVVRSLSWHGLNAESHHIVPGERDPADSVLEMARAAGADLLVMGAYGRNRMNEVIFGGFTQSILEDASIPVLLFH
jgi:nucleotide-binding universal stress UspA family protein